MPGHRIDLSHSLVKNTALFDKYQCPHCSFLLNCAVQVKCGHWLCKSCAEQLFSTRSPKCPSCNKDFKSDLRARDEYTPDQQVRTEIEKMIVYCTYRQKGCKWEGKLLKLEDHFKACTYATPVHAEDSDLSECPLAGHGCSSTEMMTKEELSHHIVEKEHLQTIADIVKNSPQTKTKKVVSSSKQVFHDSTNTQSTPTPQETMPTAFPLQESEETSQGGHMYYVATQFNSTQLVRYVMGPQHMNVDVELPPASSVDQSSLTGETEWARPTIDGKFVVLGVGKFLWKSLTSIEK